MLQADLGFHQRVLQFLELRNLKIAFGEGGIEAANPLLEFGYFRPQAVDIRLFGGRGLALHRLDLGKEALLPDIREHDAVRVALHLRAKVGVRRENSFSASLRFAFPSAAVIAEDEPALFLVAFAGD